MPNSKRRPRKSSHSPDKTIIIATKTALSAPIYPMSRLHALLKGTEMSGNERDFAKICAIPFPYPILSIHAIKPLGTELY